MASVDEAWSRPAPTASRVGFVVKLAGLGAAYLVAARFGIEQDVAHGVITPVWAPSGIAIAALVLLGPSYWPGIAVGAFLANATSGVALPTAGAIAIGNTLEAVAAENLLRRAGFAPALSRVRDVMWFVILAAVIATTISATVGITALTTAGEVTGSRYVEEWLLWWFGDLIGALLVAPPLLAWVTAFRNRGFPGRRLEGAILAALLTAVSSLVFLEGSWRYPYVIFPLLVWAALRFRQVGATAAVLFVGGVATWGTVNGAVAIGGTTATQGVQILQGLIAIVGVCIFLTAATIAERDDAEVDRVRALAQLHERTSMYETLLEAVSDLGEGFVVTDAGRLVFANAAYCQMTGYTYDELLEMPSLVELTAPEQREEIAARLRARLSGGNVVDHYEAALIRKDGRRVECEVAVELAQMDEGPRIVSLVRDVTERKKIETFRANFVSYAAHELRSPLAIIGGFVDILKRSDERDTNEKEKALERISANVATMSARIENVLALTRIERREVSLRPERIELDTFLHGIAASMPPPEGTVVEIDAATGASAWLDRSALEQIVANLLTNAYRYGGTQVRLVVRDDGSTTTIEVSDDGTGIPAGEVQRMFEPFVRGNTPRKTDGTGLGLSIVKALVEASGGNVLYTHTPDGSTFAVSVPAAP